MSKPEPEQCPECGGSGMWSAAYISGDGTPDIDGGTRPACNGTGIEPLRCECARCVGSVIKPAPGPSRAKLLNALKQRIEAQTDCPNCPSVPDMPEYPHFCTHPECACDNCEVLDAGHDVYCIIIDWGLADTWQQAAALWEQMKEADHAE